MKIEGVRDRKSEQLFNLTKLGKPLKICNVTLHHLRHNNFTFDVLHFLKASLFSQVSLQSKINILLTNHSDPYDLVYVFHFGINLKGER